MVELGVDLFRGHKPHARGREFDGKRNSVEPTADRGDRVDVRRGQRELGLMELGPLGEEADRLAARQVFDQGRILGKRERWHAVGSLSGDAQRLPRRCQDRRLRTKVENRVGKRRAGAEKVLAVIQDQEKVPRRQMIANCLLHRATRFFAETEDAADRRRDLRRIGKGSELGQPDPVWVIARGRCRHLEREPGFAAAAGPEKGEQPRFRQQLFDFGDLALATDKSGHLERQIVARARAAKGPQFGEFGREPGKVDLEEPFRLAEILQAMIAEVPERGPRWHLVANKFANSLGGQGLPSVPGGKHPRGSIQGLAEIIAASELRDAAMKGHPNPDRGLGGPCFIGEGALGRFHRGDRAHRAGERGKEGVAHGLEDEALVRLDGVAQDLVVTGEGDAHRRRFALPELGAALDIGQEEGDGSGWRVHPIAQRSRIKHSTLGGD